MYEIRRVVGKRYTHTPNMIAFVRGSLRNVWWSIRSQRSSGRRSLSGRFEAMLSVEHELFTVRNQGHDVT